jgi:hypothetical protein
MAGIRGCETRAVEKPSEASRVAKWEALVGGLGMPFADRLWSVVVGPMLWLVPD